MPKETVYGQKSALAGTSTSCSATIELDPRTPVVEVRWHRETASVQVVTCIQEAGGVGPDEPLTYEHGMYVDLDRKGINELIRKLRRAREQAFGRDE